MIDIHTIDYENLERGIVLKINCHEKNNIDVFWMERGKLKLAFHYNDETNIFLNLEGSIGEVIAKSQLDDKIKKERIFEALSHAMWYLK